MREQSKPFSRMLLFLGIIFILTSCTNAPSIQNTTPSHEAQCAALRSQMLRSTMDTNNNMPIAVARGQNLSIQQAYHNQCE